MATTSKYFVLTPSADNKGFIDFDLRFGNITTVGQTIQFNGSSRVDSIFVRPGLNYDLSNTAGGTDKIYLSGNLQDYTRSFDAQTQSLTLSRTVGGQGESVKVAGGNGLTFDNLVFANGYVSANALAVAVSLGSTLPVPNPTETSTNPQGAAASSAMLGATIKGYSTNTAAVGQVGETFATTRPGISFIASGGNGIDSVYVADGAMVDASVLGNSTDLIYLRGNWADYTKTTLSNGTKLVFTRPVGGATESVTVSTGTLLSHDRLVFADGAINTDDAGNQIATDPNRPFPTVPGVDLGITCPLYPEPEVTTALLSIRDAAEANNAGSIAAPITAVTYATAGANGVTNGNVAAINDALNSLPVNGAAADTAPEVQAIVNAYKAILASADGVANNTSTTLTGAQYTTIGVTGVSGTATAGSALALLNSAVDAKPTTSVDTIAELQALANAAANVMAAAGGTPGEQAALTQQNLIDLGLTGVTPDNVKAIIDGIGATIPDSSIDTIGELQTIVTAIEVAAANALATIAAAAQANNAVSTGLAATVFTAAGITGVGSNLPAINSALDSGPVNGLAADTALEVQAIVNAYTAILASADGTGGNTGTPITGAQYTAVGVTGLSDTATAGSVLALLDSVVDAKTSTAVDTTAELQVLSDAAARVLTAAGGNSTEAANLSVNDLLALGVTGVDANTIALVRTGLQGTTPDSAVDTLGELQTAVTAAINARPSLSTAVGGVTNLDVSSNLVFSANQTVTKGTGFIRITDLGGAGYLGDTSTNTQTIDVTSNLVTITGTGANTKIVINPQWDLDLSSNYQITIDATAFRDAGGTQNTNAFTPVNFSTITPGTHTSGTAATEAVASQKMNNSTGLMVAGNSWLNIEGIGNNTGSITQLGDLAGGAYTLAMKNYAIAPGGDPLTGGDTSNGINAHDTNIGVINFGNNDLIYFDSQVNNSTIQRFDADYTVMTDGSPTSSLGGVAGQNALILGLVSSPVQRGSSANVLLGFEGNTSNQIYAAVNNLPDGTLGWANAWHASTAPLVMG